MSILFNDLARAARLRNDKLFGSLLDLFAGEPLIDWIEGFHFIDLFKIYNDVETIINIKATINDLEKNVLWYRQTIRLPPIKNFYFRLEIKTSPKLL